MHTRPPKITVQICGKHWPRFIIVNDRQQYWTGQEWAPYRCLAMLYAHVDVVRKDLYRLRRQGRRQR